jgi:hypothetical protein
VNTDIGSTASIERAAFEGSYGTVDRRHDHRRHSDDVDWFAKSHRIPYSEVSAKVIW